MMRIVLSAAVTLLAAASLATPAGAQSPGLPDTYSFSSSNSLVGPNLTVKVNRNGSKELIERTAQPGSSNPFHDRVLYDFQAGRIYTVDLNSKLCSTQVYTSAYAPPLLDPIGGAAETQKQLAANPPKALRAETVNGIRTRAAELTGGEMSGTVWLDEKFSFMVKLVLGGGNQPQTTAFEMRQLSYAPSPAALFATPTGCTQIAGESSATGGHAEMSVQVDAQGSKQLSQAAAGGPAGSKPDFAAAKPLLGKWDFNGADKAGAAWTGTLEITALDPNSYVEPGANYNAMCDLNRQSGNSGSGVGAMCRYEPKSRTLTFGSTGDPKWSYTARLSPDGKNLAEGRWTDQAGGGTWTAKRK